MFSDIATLSSSITWVYCSVSESANLEPGAIIKANLLPTLVKVSLDFSINVLGPLDSSTL